MCSPGVVVVTVVVVVVSVLCKVDLSHKMLVLMLWRINTSFDDLGIPIFCTSINYIKHICINLELSSSLSPLWL